MERRASLDRDFVVSLAIAMAMSMAIALYTAMAWLILTSGSAPGLEVPALLFPALTVAGVLAGTAGIVLFRAERRRLREAAGREEPAVLRARLLKARIVALALVEVPAIFGLVLTLLAQDLSWSLWFGGAALVVSFLLWPGRRQLEELSGPGAGAPIEPV